MKDATDTLSKLVQSLSIASQEGWISDESAKRVFKLAMTELGFEVEVEDESGKAETERTEEGIIELYSRIRPSLEKLARG